MLSLNSITASVSICFINSPRQIFLWLALYPQLLELIFIHNVVELCAWEYDSKVLFLHVCKPSLDCASHLRAIVPFVSVSFVWEWHDRLVLWLRTVKHGTQALVFRLKLWTCVNFTWQYPWCECNHYVILFYSKEKASDIDNLLSPPYQ